MLQWIKTDTFSQTPLPRASTVEKGKDDIRYVMASSNYMLNNFRDVSLFVMMSVMLL